LVGDLNMNPFDPGVASAHGLHAVMVRSKAAEATREILGEAYRMFYNPMWGCFGDRTAGPPGTFYLSSSKPLNHFWNIYDQVLLRPALADSLAGLDILDSCGGAPLLTRGGLPDRAAASDHLPVLFRLDL
jgi:hypothetical protein